jgi:predicted enzyme related to lactoylglutathione lyase
MERHGLQGITNHFDVKSVQEYSAKVEKFGVKVIKPKTPVPVGYFSICQDTEYNTFSIFE